MDLAEEMAALGLPSSFVARMDVGSKKKSKRKLDPCSARAQNLPSGAADLVGVGATPPAQPGGNGSTQAGKFCIRSVRLFTSADSQPQTVGCGVDYTIGIGAEVSPADVDSGSRLSLSSEQYDFAMMPNGEAEVAAMPDPVRNVDSDVQLVVDDSGPVKSEFDSEPIWESVWDKEYQCYYYFNRQTLKSTWEMPPEFGHFGTSAPIAWRNDFFDTVDSAKAIEENSVVVNHECDTEEARTASGVVMSSTPVTSEHEDCEGDIMSPFQYGAGLENLTTEIRRSEGREEQSLLEQELDCDFKEFEAIQDWDDVPLPTPLNSHIRFRDSSSSNSSEADEDEGINWEEMREESLATSITQNSKEEFRGPSLHSQVSTFQNKIALHSKQLKPVKTRRFRAHIGLRGDVSRRVLKYWLQRYNLFEKYDEGVKLDEEGWYSVTPEVIATHQASRCAAGLVVDAFTGVGGNAIQLALTCNLVVAIDIDPVRVEYARHNAEIYGVAHKIDFIVGDFFRLAPSLQADVVFLSPPWGGPEYLQQEVYDLHTMLQPKAGSTLFKAAHSIAPSIALFVPRNVDLNQLQELSWLSSPPLPCEAEKNFVNGKLKSVTAYYGDIARQDYETDEF